ncbi:substrate-binding domain-containing protein, partial [Burkholderia cenocepacia]|uniref:substrate-binding domain-containing protein n=1 Tax=Burkholderia cenocepacia TaxID=95486 RepID=UPI0038CC1966
DILYVHVDSDGESVRDRLVGVQQGARGADLVSVPMGASVDDDWALVVEHRPDLLVVESSARATELRARALEVGYAVPGDLAMIVLSAPTRPEERAADFTRLDPPRTELGARAVALLSRILAAAEPLPEAELRTLIACPTISGSTVATKETHE